MKKCTKTIKIPFGLHLSLNPSFRVRLLLKRFSLTIYGHGRHEAPRIRRVRQDFPSVTRPGNKSVARSALTPSPLRPKVISTLCFNCAPPFRSSLATVRILLLSRSNYSWSFNSCTPVLPGRGTIGKVSWSEDDLFYRKYSAGEGAHGITVFLHLMNIAKWSTIGAKYRNIVLMGPPSWPCLSLLDTACFSDSLMLEDDRFYRAHFAGSSSFGMCCLPNGDGDHEMVSRRDEIWKYCFDEPTLVAVYLSTVDSTLAETLFAFCYMLITCHVSFTYPIAVLYNRYELKEAIRKWSVALTLIRERTDSAQVIAIHTLDIIKLQAFSAPFTHGNNCIAQKWERKEVESPIQLCHLRPHRLWNTALYSGS